MGRINNTTKYPLDGQVSDNDYLIGTDGDNQGITKNFGLPDIAEYVYDYINGEIEVIQQNNKVVIKDVSGSGTIVIEDAVNQTEVFQVKADEIYIFQNIYDLDTGEQVVGYWLFKKGKGYYGTDISGTIVTQPTDSFDYFLIRTSKIVTKTSDLVNDVPFLVAGDVAVYSLNTSGNTLELLSDGLPVDSETMVKNVTITKPNANEASVDVNGLNGNVTLVENVTTSKPTSNQLSIDINGLNDTENIIDSLTVSKNASNVLTVNANGVSDTEDLTPTVNVNLASTNLSVTVDGASDSVDLSTVIPTATIEKYQSIFLNSWNNNTVEDFNLATTHDFLFDRIYAVVNEEINFTNLIYTVGSEIGVNYTNEAGNGDVGGVQIKLNPSKTVYTIAPKTVEITDGLTGFQTRGSSTESPGLLTFRVDMYGIKK